MGKQHALGAYLSSYRLDCQEEGSTEGTITDQNSWSEQSFDPTALDTAIGRAAAMKVRAIPIRAMIAIEPKRKGNEMSDWYNCVYKKKPKRGEEDNNKSS